MIDFTIRAFGESSKKHAKLYHFRIWTNSKKLGWVKYEVEVIDYRRKKILRYNFRYPRRLEREIFLIHAALQYMSLGEKK